MKITTLNTGLFKLDGGAMFGVVPKRMWNKMNPSDEENLCTWSMRCLLIETEGRRILIDTGLGDKYDDRFKDHFRPHGTDSLLASLAAQGLKPEDITDVLLTHLHFDHCGGALRLNEDGNNTPTFPNAMYWSNDRQWAWAGTPNAREAASFLGINFKALEQSGQLSMIPNKQMHRWLPGIQIRFAYGHTEAMMVPIITTPDGRKLMYCADTMPSQHHVGLPFVMSYDIRPLESLKDKQWLLDFAIKNHALLVFEHDPTHEAATLVLDDRSRVKIDKLWQVGEFLS
jgi:glyoxylase-like metal-dependent hydrolase (beta-lactamase superfamily II)